MRSWIEACIRTVSLLGLLAIGASAIATDFDEIDRTDWKLVGIDVFGNRSVSREELIHELPIRLGDSVKAGDKPLRDRWCQSLVPKHRLFAAHCAMILIQPANAYMSIDVVEKGDAWRDQYPKPSFRPGLSLDPALKAKVTQLEVAKDRKFSQGGDLEEIANPEQYLDYKDPDLHKIAVELHDLAPRYQAHVLEVLNFDANGADRADAATLLNYTGDPATTASVAAAHLDDPDVNVRNNISRYLDDAAPTVTDPKVQRAIVAATAQELNRPSMQDRNKALFALSGLLEKRPALAPLIAQTACPNLNMIAVRSVMPNVGGVAKAMLATIRENHIPCPAKPAPDRITLDK